MTSPKRAASEREKRSPLLEMPRDEMAFRSEYERYLLDRSLTTVFRPGDRRWPKWRGYRPDEIVTARVIAQCGSDALRIPPEFTARRIRIRISTIDVLHLDNLAPGDFAGSSPDVQDRITLVSHLSRIYDRPPDDLGKIVTRISFTYLDQP